jgi:hypothetical protein
MLNKPIISILVPTRKRTAHLRHLLTSIEQTCVDLDHIEVLLRIDNDDVESASFVENDLPKYRYDTKAVAGDRYRGYVDLARMLDELLAVSQGQIFLFLIDDAAMITQGWDTIFRQAYDRLPGSKICSFRIRHNQKGNPDWPIFPAITREWYTALGHFSGCYQYDSFVFFLKYLTGLEVVLDIEAHHDVPSFATGSRNGEPDTTFVEGRLAAEAGTLRGTSVWSWEGQRRIIRDAIQLRRCSRSATALLRPLHEMTPHLSTAYLTVWFWIRLQWWRIQHLLDR